MKVSGAVAMADDPGHAFGIYFEKIAPGCVGSLPAGESVPTVTLGCAGGEPVPFDAQEEKPQFNPDVMVQIKARCSEQLRKLLEGAAALSGRSVNAEMVDRLERSFSEPDLVERIVKAIRAP